MHLPTTIPDVIQEGLPFGPAARNLGAPDRNFYYALMGGRHGFAAAVMLNGGAGAPEFDWTLFPVNAAARGLYDDAVKYVEQAVAFEHRPIEDKDRPIDEREPPGLLIDGFSVKALARLLCNSAVAIAGFYENTVPLLKELAHAAKNEQPRHLVEDGRLNRRLIAQFEAGTAPGARKIWDEFYDRDRMGRDAVAYGLRALHLAATELDPSHQAPAIIMKDIEPQVGNLRIKAIPLRPTG